MFTYLLRLTDTVRMISLTQLPESQFFKEKNGCKSKAQMRLTDIIGRSCHNTSTIFVTTKLLSQQTRVCHTKYLSRQNFCHANNILSQQIFHHDKSCHSKHTFVATKDVFCHNKNTFVTTKVSFRDKTFVMTKMLLVAAPANDS